eukprot:TRINITY_DN35307_c1_g1_i1.p1 TRINITY_DN35307_c1_g1~~TRINITY_DN35307_c1_g1_i1.p1  ORF type:complete len:283 (+),score=46.05 TRINITY_DN35307_c1_g1_i1:37-849(+)
MVKDSPAEPLPFEKEEDTASTCSSETSTRELRFGWSIYEGVVRNCCLNESSSGLSSSFGKVGFRLRKSLPGDSRCYWTIEHEHVDGKLPISDYAWSQGIRPGLVLSALSGKDCLNSPLAPQFLEELELPAVVELLELQPLIVLKLDTWPFAFGKLSVEQQKIRRKDLFLAAQGDEGEDDACVVIRADGKPRSEGAVSGSVVRAVNGVFRPSESEIRSKSAHLCPDVALHEVILERPLPLPARDEKFNPAAYHTRQTGNVSGRMLRPNLTF